MKKIHFENIDALRFFCFLSVFFYHSFYTESEIIKQSFVYKFIKYDLFGNANLGVNFFFVLSGFLVTFLLLNEKKTHSKVNVIHFYFRRILRIWPLFYICVFIGFVIFPLIKNLSGLHSSETANVYSYLFFINNFDILKHGQPDSSILAVLWSIAVEEQFYLIWPLVVSFFPLKKLWIIFVLIILQSLIFRWVFQIEIYGEIHTLSCIGDMATGALSAWLIIYKNFFKNFIEHLDRSLIKFIYLLLFIIYFYRDEMAQITPLFYVIDRTYIALIFAFIILEQCFCQNSLFKLSKFRLISKLGTMTYGLYCLHFIGILITLLISKKLENNTSIYYILLFEVPLSLGLSIILAAFSYNFFEKPLLKIKDRFNQT